MIGKTIGQYKITEKLGAGGMGEVYLAEDTKLQRKVALKFLPEKFSADAEFNSRFEHEAKAAASLNHPNIVTVFDLGEHEGSLYIAMEYVDGKSLESLIGSESLNLAQTIDIAEQISRGVGAAHRAGVVHRDIKPANIIVTTDGLAKILDFGLAKSQRATIETKIGSTLGTVQYESPEQSRGAEVDQRSDLFSLGVVMYQMITGALPFEGEYEASIRYAISNDKPKPLSRYVSYNTEALQRIIDKLLEKDPSLRYQSAADLLSDLRKLQQTPTSPVDERRSVAVLPFRNMSADPEQEFFCDGIAEDIINDLTQVEGLRVAARTSSFSFKSADTDIREICAKLNVTAILEGSVRKAGNRLRVTAQLINASDGYHVWSERFDRELNDVFEVQEEIAASVTAALKLKLGGTQKEKIAKRSTENVEAYEYYLKARQLSRQSGKEIYHAVKLYNRAIEADPNYALAYAGLAAIRTEIYMYFDSDLGILKMAEEASARALELDPDLAEAHSARGYYLSQASDYQEAEKQFQRALQLNPNSYDACHHYGRVCIVNNKNKLASELFERAIEIDPSDIFSAALLHQIYERLGEKQKAKAATGEALRKLHKHLLLNPDDLRALQLAATQSAKAGNKDDAHEYLDKTLQLAPSETGVLYNGACTYALIGDADRSLDLLGKALSKGQHLYDWAATDSDLDSLRNDPRFQELLAKRGKTRV